MKKLYKVITAVVLTILCSIGVSMAVTAPTFDVTPKLGSKLNIGDRITVVIKTANSYTALRECEYSLNGSAYKSVFDLDGVTCKHGEVWKFTFNSERFYTAGDYVLRMKAVDEYDNVSKMTCRYVVEDDAEDEDEIEELFTFTATPKSGNKLNIDDKVKVVIEANNDAILSKCEYSLNGSEYCNMLINDLGKLSKFTFTFGIFSEVGEYELKIRATDEYDNISETTFNYVVEDTTSPIISVNKASGSILKPGEDITIVVEDLESKITLLSYQWNSAKKVDFIPNYKGPVNKCTIKNLKIGTLPGIYTIRITAENEGGNPSVAIYKYIVEEEIDVESPTVSANLASGEIAPLSTITLNLEDNEALKTLTYNWDDGSSVVKSVSGVSASVKVTAPSTTGSHKLYVTVRDGANNQASRVFTYTVKKVDKTAPTMKTNVTSESAIAPSSTITLTLRDNEALKSVTYYWAGKSSIVKSISGTSASVKVTAPSTTGSHKLYVTVSDGANNQASRVFTYTVKKVDKTAPTMSINVSSQSTIAPSSTITLTLRDNEALKSMTYHWDGNSNIVKSVSGTSASVKVTAPSTTGSHKLYVTVSDGANNQASRVFTYTVKKVDKTAPTVSASPTSGRKIKPSSVVTITAKDNEKLRTVTYYWDSNKSTSKSVSTQSTTIKVTAPKTRGTHKLYVTVMDSSYNQVKRTFTYTVGV